MLFESRIDSLAFVKVLSVVTADIFLKSTSIFIPKKLYSWIGLILPLIGILRDWVGKLIVLISGSKNFVTVDSSLLKLEISSLEKKM